MHGARGGAIRFAALRGLGRFFTAFFTGRGGRICCRLTVRLCITLVFTRFFFLAARVAAAKVGHIPAATLQLELRCSHLFRIRRLAAGRAICQRISAELLQHIIGVSACGALVGVDWHGSKTRSVGRVGATQKSGNTILTQWVSAIVRCAIFAYLITIFSSPAGGSG